MSTLHIEDLHVTVEDKEILKGVNLTINKGETHAIMGPNGSGKSTLAYAVAGHPAYEITGGSIRIDDEDLTDAGPDDRALAGLFLAMQYPVEIPGVSTLNFLRTAMNTLNDEPIGVREFMDKVKVEMENLKMNPEFLERNVNEGFSGGEKKRFEILQMALVKPTFAILDETDSGLDVDALRVVSEGINAQRGPDLGVMLITHYTRILQYITPDNVHVMSAGRIVKSGSADLAAQLEAEGFEQFA
ncbi:Fe-S cluster assembly ATPase SufC [Stomatohabitans albus]|uniref:Fe-S cluster assembly ATPase SufC n=1 Tax=Stomatohabitans albus TaxID=3110766 RepID=UPI00300D323C